MDAQDLRDRTARFALDVGTFCDTLAGDSRTQDMARQLSRAAHSQALAYGAACRARSHDEFVAKICITILAASKRTALLTQQRRREAEKQKRPRVR